MMEYEELEPMEYEYTSPQHSLFHSHYYKVPEKMYVPPPTGSFPIPESFFEKQYNKTTAVANKVADAFMSFSINDPEEKVTEQPPPPQPQQHYKEQEVHPDTTSESTQEEHDPLPSSPSTSNQNVLALYSPPLSPRQHTQDSMSPSKSMLDTSMFSVDQETTQAPTSLPKSNYSLNPTPNYNPSFIHSPYYQPSYNYYYKDTTPDPLAKSHGTVHLLQGLFRMVIITVVFTAASYTIFYIGDNFRHDMIEKVRQHESDILTTQLSCRTSYESNRCSSDARFPAILEMCREWERCMYRPLVVSRSQAFAETFADMANGFSDKLSNKTLVMTIILGITLIWAITRIVMGHPNSQITTPQIEAQKERLSPKVNSKIEPMKFESNSPF